MNSTNKKSFLPQILDIANLIAIFTLLITIWQLSDNLENNKKSNLALLITHNIDMVLPCWEQWKTLYHKSQYLGKHQQSEDSLVFFLSNASIAQDRWNETIKTLGIRTGSIDTNSINRIQMLISEGKFSNVTDEIHSILKKNIQPVMNNIGKQLDSTRTTINKTTFPSSIFQPFKKN